MCVCVGGGGGRGGDVTGYRYLTHLYCLAVQAGFYSDAVDCRTLSSAYRVRSSVGENIISFYLYKVRYIRS